MANQSALLYVSDPMCSWCYGFGAELEDFRNQTGFNIFLVLGGLRPGKMAEPMDDSLKEFLKEHWSHVAEASGQPFNLDFFARDGFLYDTEPACRAVVGMRSIKQEAAFPFLRAVAYAFYAENVDITNPVELSRIASVFVDPELFLSVYKKEETLAATYEDFRFAAEDLSVRGFPALFLLQGGKAYLLANGFQKSPELLEALHTVTTSQACLPK